MESFKIQHNDQIVGIANVEVEGLYYHFSCSCKLPDKSLHRIFAVSDKGKTDLGVCIPKEDAFALTKRIPIKQVGQKIIAFQIDDKDSNSNLRMLPVFSDKPFEHIDKLENAHLKFRDGMPQIIITDPK